MKLIAVVVAALAVWIGGAGLVGAASAQAVPTESRPLDDRLVQAREALRKRDRAKLAAHRDALVAARHPLAMWADYWELSNRLAESNQSELDAFYARWPGTYVEDRLRNDWLLELGRRRDWRNFATDYPRFKFNDDREVSCYALLLRHHVGEDVRAGARANWFLQRDGDDGCTLLVTTLYTARLFSSSDVWLKAREAAEAKRLNAARQALTLLGEDAGASLTELFEQPQRYLARRADTDSRQGAEYAVMALARLAASDPAAAATELQDRWQTRLSPEAAAWAWGSVARQGAMKLLPESDGWFQRASGAAATATRDVDWNDDTLGWRVRSALRATDAARWQRVLDAVAAMSAAAQADPTWVYWKARALHATAKAGTEGDAQRTAASVLFERIAGQLNFYGKLAAEELGRPQSLPPRPAAITPEERVQAHRQPGLTRALALIALGLRSEGVREWNFSIRELSDRPLLAAAQRACDNEVWDRCINTSERTRQEIDLSQRFPTPFRADVVAAAQDMGIDPAYVYGLIRQESRFVTDARSGVGASGLMQVMPATARWTAKRLGMAYTPDLITDKATNLRLGTGYLKLVLDDFGGSQAMAAAGYNAGPNRPRRWREGPVMEVAAWAENIPFNETRDYVKKVLSNASYYAAVMGGKSVVDLKSRLSPLVGPRPADAPPENRQLP
ncbi:lytic transglycosylase domain-containing protein [Sphaerotilus sp.]|uniref:lytic transglycosylase domain-containing protein n=1 Tax=Sphaerotilus sp. TaxID=2093942 RepID=UPI00286E5158|nr:lytic transglycosylase domain-containing protein [Sphaerotilus sp.]